MKIARSFALGALSIGWILSTAAAQNIQTNTTSTTVGSTSFGFGISPAQLQTVMQSVTPLTCDARTGGVMNCSLDNFQKAPGLPGAFTSSPIPGGLSAAPNFACGPTTSSANCLSLLERIEGGEIVGNEQTAPHADGRDLAGTLNSTIDLGGTETPGMPTGFISFILDPGTGGGDD